MSCGKRVSLPAALSLAADRRHQQYPDQHDAEAGELPVAPEFRAGLGSAAHTRTTTSLARVTKTIVMPRNQKPALD